MYVNVNCKAIDKFGFCNKKPKIRLLKILWFVKQDCPLYTNWNTKCSSQEKYPRPKL